MDDLEAFELYPQYRHWYNKLFLSIVLGYTCGFDTIPSSGRWIIRPIQNLVGMGLGASIGHYSKGFAMVLMGHRCIIASIRNQCHSFLPEWRERSSNDLVTLRYTAIYCAGALLSRGPK